MARYSIRSNNLRKRKVVISQLYLAWSTAKKLKIRMPKKMAVLFVMAGV